MSKDNERANRGMTIPGTAKPEVFYRYVRRGATVATEAVTISGAAVVSRKLAHLYDVPAVTLGSTEAMMAREVDL